MTGRIRAGAAAGVLLLAALLAPPRAPLPASEPAPPSGPVQAQADADARQIPLQLPGEIRTPAGNRIRFQYPDSVLAGRVLRALEEMAPLPGLPELTPRDVEVVLVPDRGAFAEATGGRPPEWSAGVAVPSRGLIVLPTWEGAQIIRPGAGQLLRHEWAHVATFRASGGLRAPRWFSEGYAEWAGGWDRSRAWRLRLLLALGRTPPLDSLSLSWPAGRARAESAYLLSASVVQYLVEASGERGLAALFRRWRDTGRFETGLREVYGLTSSQLEEDWRAWARDRYGWVYVFSHSTLAWGLLALLLVGTAWFRRRHNRDRMARLRAREIPEAPAFWEPGQEGPPGDPGPAPPAAPPREPHGAQPPTGDPDPVVGPGGNTEDGPASADPAHPPRPERQDPS